MKNSKWRRCHRGDNKFMQLASLVTHHSVADKTAMAAAVPLPGACFLRTAPNLGGAFHKPHVGMDGPGRHRAGIT